jgi:hypothetical protein
VSEDKQPVETSPVVNIPVVLKVIDDWEQDYFVPISLPLHTKAHMDQALAQLRERIKGLVA